MPISVLILQALLVVLVLAMAFLVGTWLRREWLDLLARRRRQRQPLYRAHGLPAGHWQRIQDAQVASVRDRPLHRNFGLTGRSPRFDGYSVEPQRPFADMAGNGVVWPECP